MNLLMRNFSTRHWFGTIMSFLSFRVSRAGVSSDLSAGAFLAPSAFSRKRELRFPPRISREKTAPSHQALQKRHHHTQIMTCARIYGLVYKIDLRSLQISVSVVTGFIGSWLFPFVPDYSEKQGATLISLGWILRIPSVLYEPKRFEISDSLF